MSTNKGNGHAGVRKPLGKAKETRVASRLDVVPADVMPGQGGGGENCCAAETDRRRRDFTA